jgi:hypothetical protein
MTTHPGTSATVNSADDPVRLVIGEDSVLFRGGIARLLEEAGFVVRRHPRADRASEPGG